VGNEVAKGAPGPLQALNRQPRVVEVWAFGTTQRSSSASARNVEGVRQDESMPRPVRHNGRPRPSSDADPFIAQMRHSFGTQTVTVVNKAGTDEENRFEVEAHIQGKTGSFPLETPIFTGDIVEMPDPRRGMGGVERRYVATARPLTAGPRDMNRVKVEWGDEPAPPRVAPFRRLTFENLHPDVKAAAADLFTDGHFEAAVNEAFKSIEVRVRALTGIEKSAVSMMAQAFKPDGSVMDVASHEGRSGDDEREGFMHIFRGAMMGIRNPGAHELVKPGDPDEALEYLGFASLLHRRIDVADAKKV
jgi:uncharacterized protein (TIGR02391 family)